jgi:hypothetical protein
LGGGELFSVEVHLEFLERLKGVFVAMQQFEQHDESQARGNPHFRVRSPIGRFA